MSLLQELSRDTQFLLKNTHATREQLEQFLNITGLDLGDILYRQSKCNLFVDWLEHHEKLDKNYLFVNINMLEYLIDKKDKNQPYTNGEMINCYAYDAISEKYFTCVNINEMCELEEYNITKEIIEEIDFWN